KVVLVADIDRGGVFAQIIGTLDLLAPDERARICGIVINRFRGDAGLFAEGVQWLEQRTRIPILGVIPFLRDLVLDQEDSLEPHCHTEFCAERVNIAVVLLPRMSNFTDFNPLIQEGDVVLRYAAHPKQLAGADVVVLPGSKNTQADLGYLRDKGFVPALNSHVHRMGELIGICGGFQMLGQRITDPHGVEAGGDATGLGYLRMETELRQQKQTAQVDACPADWISPESIVIRGYHIHMGVTTQLHEQPCFTLLGKDGQVSSPDGAVRKDGLVWGTHIHGLFDHPRFRRAWLNRVRIRKDLLPIGVMESEMTTSRMTGELDRWTDHLAKYVNTTPLFNLLQSQTA
ncbi:MAG TPA: cobyric acid synthase, partial [Nitrospiraceae bacterium]